MASHTRRRILQGAALTAAGSVVGGLGLGPCVSSAAAAGTGPGEGATSFPFL
ncbi:hypothetical protein [Streptomyces sp. NBC_00963]